MSTGPTLSKLLFSAAAGITDPNERKTFLDHVCANNPSLRMELEELLEFQNEADTFFEFPPQVDNDRTSDGDEGLGARIGRYRLIERIGAGGCGAVYLAEQEEPVRRKVALKIVRLGMNTENVIARFEAERQALALMDHPNIARVYDAGATGSGRPYFVMELVDGEPITRFCEGCSLSLRERLELFIQVCQAIQHAHQKGVIHRDIKPSNVLVRLHDGIPVPKVIDFGIAKATSAGRGETATFTSFDQFLGTPAYMSPEQASNSIDVDTRSDIYSLGVLLYEMVCGKPPFDPQRLIEAGTDMTRRILREEDPKPPSAYSKISTAGDLDSIVMKAIEKDRQHRYDTANGLSMDVLRFLNNEPVTARPASRRYRLGKLIRRNKIAFAAGSVTAVSLVAGLAVSTWLFFREKRAREEMVVLHDIAQASRMNEMKLRQIAEYRTRVAQAAVQISRNHLDEADQDLASVPVESTPVSLEAADSYRRLAEWHVANGRWKEAAARYASAVHALSNVDDSVSYNISWNMLPAAAAVCFANDLDRYETMRSFAIQRFSKTDNPQVAEQVLKATLLTPMSEKSLRELDGLEQLVEDTMNIPNHAITKDPYLAAWSCFALGLKSIRDGDDIAATSWLNRCLAVQQANEPRVASARFLLSMIESHRGNRSGAYDLIEQSREAVMNAVQKSPPLSGGKEGIWFDWLIAKVLLDEAYRSLGR